MGLDIPQAVLAEIALQDYVAAVNMFARRWRR
jgi:hypothetical protein